MIDSILCEGVIVPDEGSRITYTYISGGSYPNYEFSQVSSFLGDASEKDVIRCVNTLRTLAGDEDHIFIEAFAPQEDRSYAVILGS